MQDDTRPLHPFTLTNWARRLQIRLQPLVFLFTSTSSIGAPSCMLDRFARAPCRGCLGCGRQFESKMGRKALEPVIEHMKTCCPEKYLENKDNKLLEKCRLGCKNCQVRVNLSVRSVNVSRSLMRGNTCLSFLP